MMLRIMRLGALRRLIAERIRQDVKSKNGHFDWREFVHLAAEGDDEIGRTLGDRITLALWYARWRLKALGKGAARAVYALTSKSVLKIALDEDGIAQNEIEIKISSSAPADVPIVRVKQHAIDAIWITSELVRPVRNAAEFESLAGYDVDLLAMTLKELVAQQSAGHAPQKSDVDPFVWGAWRAVVHGELAIIDVANIAHWGVTPDRRLVLLDYGYTQEMYDSLPGFFKD